MAQSHAAALWVPAIGAKVRRRLEGVRVEGEALEVCVRKSPVATCAVLHLDSLEGLQWNFECLDELARETAEVLGLPTFALYAVFGSANHLRVTQYLPGGRRGWSEAEVDGRWKKHHRVLASALGLRLATDSDDEDEDEDELVFHPTAAGYWRLFSESYPDHAPVELVSIGLKPALHLSDEEGWKSLRTPAVVSKAAPTLTPLQAALAAAAAGDLKTLGTFRPTLLREHGLSLMNEGGWDVFDALRKAAPRAAAEYLDEALHSSLDQVQAALARGAKPARPEELLPLLSDPRLLQRLIENGARVTRRNGAGETLLHLHSDARCIKVLAKAGVDPNIANARGNTPLALAVGYLEQNAVDRVKALLGAGADPTVRYNDVPLLEQLERVQVERKSQAGLQARAKQVRQLLERALVKVSGRSSARGSRGTGRVTR